MTSEPPALHLLTPLTFLSSVTAETIENSLVVAPRHESMLFSNRDKFDLVAVYDDASESINDTPALAALLRAIYTEAFRKMLRNMPLILVGGFRAWKARFGAEELVRGGTESATEVPGSSSTVLQSIGESPLVNAISSPRPNGPIMPSAPLVPLPSPSLVPMSGHARVPAESSAPPIVTSPLLDSTNFGRAGPMSPTLQDTNAYKMWVPPPGATPVPPDNISLSLRYALHYKFCMECADV